MTGLSATVSSLSAGLKEILGLRVSSIKQAVFPRECYINRLCPVHGLAHVISTCEGQPVSRVVPPEGLPLLEVLYALHSGPL